MNDHELAAALAAAAGQQLLTLREQHAVAANDAAAANALAALADASANRWLLAQLATHRPADAVLSEEADDDRRRLAADRVWIIDPVDGTYEFARSLADFAVHVALWDNHGREFLAAAVAVPEHAAVWATGSPSQPPACDRAELTVVSSSRESKQVLDSLATTLAAVAPEFGFESVRFRRLGSVGGKVHQLLAGQADVYVSTSGFWEWDAAAPAAVAVQHGLVVTDAVGEALQFNQAEPRVPSFVAARAEFHPHVIAALSKVLR